MYNSSYVREDNGQIENREIFYVNDGDAFRTMTTKMTRAKNWQASTKRKPSPKSTFLHDIRTVLKVIRAIGLYPAQIIRSIDDDSGSYNSTLQLYTLYSYLFF